jgi:hypothetical protein
VGHEGHSSYPPHGQTQPGPCRGWEALIFFQDATHWVQHDAAEEVNHYLIDFLLDKDSKQMKR